MTLAIGITLAPREESTIDLVIQSIRDEGYTAPIYIFAEPDSQLPFDINCVVIQNEEQL